MQQVQLIKNTEQLKVIIRNNLFAQDRFLTNIHIPNYTIQYVVMLHFVSQLIQLIQAGRGRVASFQVL